MRRELAGHDKPGAGYQRWQISAGSHPHRDTAGEIHSAGDLVRPARGELRLEHRGDACPSREFHPIGDRLRLAEAEFDKLGRAQCLGSQGEE